jgi:VanZ family protein
MVVIFILSSRQRIVVSEEYWANFLIFKSLHIIEYAILAACNTIAIAKNSKGMKLSTVALAAALFALIYAITDEVHQLYVPTRSGMARDVLIDSIGIFSVYWSVLHYEKSKKHSSASLHRRTSQ